MQDLEFKHQGTLLFKVGPSSGPLTNTCIFKMCIYLFTRSVPAKFKTGMCEMKILGSEILWCVLGHWFRMDWHTCGITSRSVPAKFKTGMCEMKILGSEILWCVLGHWLPIGNGSGAKHLWIKFKWPRSCFCKSPTNSAPRNSTLFFGCNPSVAEYFSMWQTPWTLKIPKLGLNKCPRGIIFSGTVSGKNPASTNPVFHLRKFHILGPQGNTMIYPWKIVIFHSYVSLPEGKPPLITIRSLQITIKSPLNHHKIVLNPIKSP